MSSVGINERIFHYSLTPHQLHRYRMMGCASSQSGSLPGSTGTEKTATISSSGDKESSTKYPPAEAFEISLDDVDDKNNDDRSDSLIKKHPPKRLQKLVEQAATAVPPATLEYLEEKLAKAEVRRQQYIQQRIDNIATVTGRGGGGVCGIDVPSDGCEAEGNDHNDVQNDEEHNGDGNASVDDGAAIESSGKDAVVVQSMVSNGTEIV